MRNLCLVLLMALATASVSVSAADGAALYGSCIACHGAQGEGNVAMKAPALAAQDASYLARQLQHFKEGVRGADPSDSLGAQMRGMAAVLPDAEAIAAVSAYMAGLPPVAVEESLQGDLRNGENQYNGACGACHGGSAEGNPALNSPRLAGLNSEYLRRQYENFASGVRGSHPDDRFGAQMKMMSSALGNEKNLTDVLFFISTQGQ